jgi:hypothetical protein
MTMDCAAFRAVAPELALGVAVGDERAAALGHLATCAACRHDLDRLTAAVDALVTAAPEAEPSSGFEVRALATFEPAPPAPALAVAPGGLTSSAGAGVAPTSNAGTGTTSMSSVSTGMGSTSMSSAAGRSGRSGRSDRSVRRWLAMAAVFVALAALGLGLARLGERGSGTPSDQAAVATRSTADLTAPAGQTVGSVRVDRRPVADGGSTSQLVVSVDPGAPQGTYRVQCDYESGRPYGAGELVVGPNGLPHWSATVSVPTYDLRRVRLISTTGSDNLEAEFPS